MTSFVHMDAGEMREHIRGRMEIGGGYFSILRQCGVLGRRIGKSRTAVYYEIQAEMFCGEVE